MSPVKPNVSLSVSASVSDSAMTAMGAAPSIAESIPAASVKLSARFDIFFILSSFSFYPTHSSPV